MTSTMTDRDRIAAERAEAARLAAEAEARQAAARQAERELNEREHAATGDAHRAYRERVNKAGGIARQQNAAWEKFAQAVRDGDGAAVLTTWIAWRKVKAARYGEEAEMTSYERQEHRAANPHSDLPALVDYQRVPDFPGDLARVMEQIEHEQRSAAIDQVRDYVATHVDKALGR